MRNYHRDERGSRHLAGDSDKILLRVDFDCRLKLLDKNVPCRGQAYRQMVFSELQKKLGA